MLFVEALKYRDRLGSYRYSTFVVVPEESKAHLLVFDPGPPGAERIVLAKIKRISKDLRRYYGLKLSSIRLLLTHTHPSTAGSVGGLMKALKDYKPRIYAHVRSVPFLEADKSAEVRVRYRFERATERKVRLFQSLSPIIYRPYYRRFVLGFRIPKDIEALMPESQTPEDFSRRPLDLGIELDISRMRSAGHSYEHVVYRIKADDRVGLILGDEGPYRLGDFRIRYNDATSRSLAIDKLSERHEKIREGIEEARVFRTHGAARVSYVKRQGMIERYLNNIVAAVREGFFGPKEALRLRISDVAAAMLLRDRFARLIKNPRGMHYINAENLPIFTTRAALVYVNGKGPSGEIYTRYLDPAGKYRYIELKR